MPQNAKKTRKTRVDSKENAVAAMIHADKVLNPPANMNLNAEERECFDEVIAEFAKIDWTRHSLRLASILARGMDQLRKLQISVTDDYTVTTPKGGVAMNPEMSALNMLSGQIMNLRKTLALHAISGVNKVDVGKRRAINRNHERNAPDDDEGLISKPDVA